ncbi:putative apoptosis inhibitor [Diachasmimorpha longicaudata entomopoxvirus]|uniref:Putative apoptosis inhibitor n=1 Tax=Diachasmimorpha longicaudata entomopoxvirus TaxID=109981 RepID=A0A7R5WD75_9POXV|nr:putative apoptosis inhibitor [Diachasmimorpha longicaudata entomopoxvirus]AKS26432.1 putative apoptosis inhibitor [Diachasmimorpha longicaudata entomopoxvirus]
MIPSNIKIRFEPLLPLKNHVSSGFQGNLDQLANVSKSLFELNILARNKRFEMIIDPKMIWHCILHQTYLLINFNQPLLENFVRQVPDTELPEIKTKKDIFPYYREKFDKVYNCSLFRKWVTETSFTTQTDSDIDIIKMMFVGSVMTTQEVIKRVYNCLTAINIVGTKDDWVQLQNKVMNMPFLLAKLPQSIKKWQNDLLYLIDKCIETKDFELNLPFWSQFFTFSDEYTEGCFRGPFAVLQRFMVDFSQSDQMLIERDRRIFLHNIHNEETRSTLTIGGRKYTLTAGANKVKVMDENMLDLGLGYTLAENGKY